MDVGIMKLLNFGCLVQNIFEKDAFLAPGTQCYLAAMHHFLHLCTGAFNVIPSSMNYFG